MLSSAFDALHSRTPGYEAITVGALLQFIGCIFQDGLYTPGGSKAGYYLPSKDPKQAEREVDAFYRVQRARCLHGPKAIAAAGRFLKIPAGQLGLDDL